MRLALDLLGHAVELYDPYIELICNFEFRSKWVIIVLTQLQS